MAGKDDERGVVATAATDPEDVEYLWVKSGREDDRVALSERDDLHPADVYGIHEAYVAGRDSRPTLVALTAAVDRGLRNGDIKEVDEDAVVEWHENLEERRAVHLAMMEGRSTTLDPATQKVLAARNVKSRSTAKDVETSTSASQTAPSATGTPPKQPEGNK